MKKRLLSLLLTLVMILGMLPATAMTASAAAPKSVWVAGMEVDNGSYLAIDGGGTIDYEPSGGYAYYKDGVLTLNNYSYTGEGYHPPRYDVGIYAAIYCPDDVTIRLMGSNTLTANGGAVARLASLWMKT